MIHKFTKCSTFLNTCICIAESLCCTPETNTALQINYTSIKNNKVKRIKRKEVEYAGRTGNHVKILDQFCWYLTEALVWGEFYLLSHMLLLITISDILYALVLSPVSHAPFLVTLWTAAHQAPLSMGFSRQEYQGELPFSSLGDLLHSGIETTSLLQAGSLPLVPPGKPQIHCITQ